LALQFTNYPNVYVCSDTAPVSSGTSPVTLAPRGGVENHLLWPLRVSIDSPLSDVYSTDIGEGMRTKFVFISCGFCPLVWGGQNHKNRDYNSCSPENIKVCVSKQDLPIKCSSQSSKIQI